MAREKTLHQRLLHRRGVIGIAEGVEARARVIRARLEVLVREFDERMMLSNRDGFRQRSDGADPVPFRIADKRQRRLELGVLRKALRAR